MNDLSSASGVPRWLVPALTVFATSGAAATFLLVPFGDDGVLLKALLVVMFGGGFALGAANVVQAVVMTVSKRPGLLAFSRRAMLLVKLGLVPFYLAGGVLVALFGMLSLGFLPFGSTMPLLTIAPLVTFGWILMACCSAWMFVYAVGLKRARLLSSSACAAFCILSLFFVADVVCAVVLFAYGRKRERITESASQAQVRA